MIILAVVVSDKGGYDSDKEQFRKAGFKLGDKIEVEDINMSQSSTSIKLKDHGWFNSVFFDFEENGEELDIYSDSRFNPYL